MKKYLIIFLVAVFLISCENDEETLPINEFNVVVVGTDINCKLPVIKFLQEDADRISKLTTQEGLQYVALNLDSTYNTEGQMLTVVVRKTQENELFACITLGLSYPWVTVLGAEIPN